MPYSDPFDTQNPPQPGMAAPFTLHETAVLGDTSANDFARLTRAVWIGAAGNVALVTEDGTAITYTVPAGTVIPGRFRRCNTTNTTVAAAQIIGWA